MKLFRRLIDGITDKNVFKRFRWLYVTFFGIFFPVAIASHYLLPESVFRGKHPIVSRIELSPDLLASALQIFGLNLIPMALITAANLFAKRSRVSNERFVPIGYQALWALTFVCAMVLGTWSFEVVTAAPPLHARLLRMFDLTRRSGLLEFSAYTLAAAASCPLTLWFLDRRRRADGKTTLKDVFRGGKLARTKRCRELKLSRSEKVLLAAAPALLLCAALIEAHSIIEATKAAASP